MVISRIDFEPERVAVLGVSNRHGDRVLLRQALDPEDSKIEFPSAIRPGGRLIGFRITE
jgi:hypothetical protein